MNWFERLQQAIDYMEDHLLDNINYEDVAKSVQMSSYNFHRTFSLMAGMTANVYIRNRRLSLAGHELQTTEHRVIDVGYKYGYETPESFAKAFTRFHGATPKAAKLSGTQLSLFNPLLIKLSLEGGKAMDYRLEKSAKKRFMTIVRPFRNDTHNDENNHEISYFWRELHANDGLDPLLAIRPQGKKDLFGLCTPTVATETTFDYGIGVLIDEETLPFDEVQLLKEGFRLWDVEPATYVVLNCYGDNGDCISEMWRKFLTEFSPQTGYKQTEQTDYEIYFETSEPGLFCELWIPVTKH